MRIGIVGINHKQADLQLREKLARICERRFGPDRSAHTNHSFILLSTCNRTEIYFSSENLAETHTYILNILRNDLDDNLRNDLEGQFDQKLYSYFNDDCFHHLARVTAGLDSAIIFETEIQGQVKSAYEKAVLYATLSSDLHFLFQKCLRIGKKIRSSMPLHQGSPDIEHTIFSMGLHLFKSVPNQNILFVGASNINIKIIQYFKKRNFKNMTLCNRTYDKAEAIAKKNDLKILHWEYLSEWHHYDLIIFGTKSPHFLVSKNTLSSKTMNSKKLVIDLSVPRNVDPSLHKHSFITLLNIDQINRMLKIRKKEMAKFITMRESFVKNSTHELLQIFKTKLKRASLFARQNGTTSHIVL